MLGIELLHPTDWQNMIMRLSIAIIVGGLIGWDRELDNKPAGLRTHMLVSLGSAVFVMTAIQTGMVEESADTISRIIQGIATGIGFLGAGEIFSVITETEGVRVKGLTSAAAIWVTTALGVAAGCGLWMMCLFSVVATLAILRIAKKLEESIERRRRQR